jgi:hypothetical protein
MLLNVALDCVGLDIVLNVLLDWMLFCIECCFELNVVLN